MWWSRGTTQKGGMRTKQTRPRSADPSALQGFKLTIPKGVMALSAPQGGNQMSQHTAVRRQSRQETEASGDFKVGKRDQLMSPGHIADNEEITSLKPAGAGRPPAGAVRTHKINSNGQQIHESTNRTMVDVLIQGAWHPEAARTTKGIGKGVAVPNSERAVIMNKERQAERVQQKDPKTNQALVGALLEGTYHTKDVKGLASKSNSQIAKESIRKRRKTGSADFRAVNREVVQQMSRMNASAKAEETEFYDAIAGITMHTSGGRPTSAPLSRPGSRSSSRHGTQSRQSTIFAPRAAKQVDKVLNETGPHERKAFRQIMNEIEGIQDTPIQPEDLTRGHQHISGMTLADFEQIYAPASRASSAFGGSRTVSRVDDPSNKKAVVEKRCASSLSRHASRQGGALRASHASILKEVAAMGPTTKQAVAAALHVQPRGASRMSGTRPRPSSATPSMRGEPTGRSHSTPVHPLQVSNNNRGGSNKSSRPTSAGSVRSRAHGHRPQFSAADLKKAQHLVGLLRDKLASRLASGPNELRRAFKLLDKDGSGTITISEFTKFLVDHGIDSVVPIKDAALVFALADENNSGKVDYNEFARTLWESDFKQNKGPGNMVFGDAQKKPVNTVQSIRMQLTNQQALQIIKNKIDTRLRSGPHALRRSFQFFDKDGNGSISEQEFKEVLLSFGLELPNRQIKDIMKMFDTDGNGQLDYNEFVRGMSDKAFDTTQKGPGVFIFGR